MNSRIFVVLFAGLMLLPIHVNATPKLNSNTSLATAGYFQLAWSNPSQAEALSNQYELQQADNANFLNAATIYRGPDEATVISGLANNEYFYRVRLVDTPNWSETVKVDIEHHSLTRAFSFFALGAFMFIATIVVLMKGIKGQLK